jgi:hypothetical protein
MADSDALIKAFDRYVSGLSSADGGRFLVISLASLRGLTSESFNAGGMVRIDLTNGSVVSEIRGLPSSDAFDLWLIDNRPGAGQTTFAESQDVLLKVGTYSWTSGLHALSTQVSVPLLSDFFPDRALVVRSGGSPLNSFVLTGSSTSFDRLYQRQVRFVGEGNSALGFDPREPSTRAANFGKLVGQGRQVFLNEGFDGNGRTCGTCHVESNNFTIDPKFISTLPQSDPLLVAETNPALGSLENPNLMRNFGLILVKRRWLRAPKKLHASFRSKRAGAGQLYGIDQTLASPVTSPVTGRMPIRQSVSAGATTERHYAISRL